jgi:hypothetical protein
MKFCFECNNTHSLHKHHVVPRSLGGTKVVYLCEKCHGIVHNRRFNTTHLTTLAMSKRRKDNYIISSKLPFGYKASICGKKLVPLKKQQFIIKRIVKYKNVGKTLTYIANTLNKEKVKTQYNKVWKANTVLSILKRYNKLCN